MTTHKRLRNMTNTSGNNNSAQNYSQDCSICLNSIAVRALTFPSSLLPPLIPLYPMRLEHTSNTNLPCSPASAYLWRLAPTRGTINAYEPSWPRRRIRYSSARTAGQPRISRPKSKTRKNGSSLTRTRETSPSRELPCRMERIPTQRMPPCPDDLGSLRAVSSCKEQPRPGPSPLPW